MLVINRTSVQCKNRRWRLARSAAVSAIFENISASCPDQLALISRYGTLSYADLNERANQLARHLRSVGIEPGSVVAVALQKGSEYVIAMIASWKLQATYLPLDQSTPAKRMEYMISDSGASCLITIKKILEEKTLGSTLKTILSLDDKALIDRLRTYPCSNMHTSAGNDAVAYIIYTSGTTGVPKGVAISHSNLSNLIEDIRQSREIEPSDRVLLFSPFCFDASIRDIAGAMMLGASLYIPQDEEILPGSLMKTIAQQGITNSVITPSILRACAWEHLPDLKTIVLAGEAADEFLIKTWGAGRKLINAYGPTEATVCCTKQVYLDGQIPLGCSASVIGSPILKTKISILNEENRSMEHGEVGEICITGPNVSHHGYLNRPNLNRERFLTELSDQYRSYKTGDLGRILPNGKIECLGRKDQAKQIKLNGQRIELQEIENVLRKSSDVLDVAVILRGEAPAQRLCAYMVPVVHVSNEEEESLIKRLKTCMWDSLPSYSVPSTIEVLDAFPLSSSKKLDVKALVDLASKNARLSDSREADLTQLEGKVAAALLTALSLPQSSKIYPSTTYAELGGNSLQASIVLRHLNQSMGCNIGFSQFYRKDTSVRHLASLVEGVLQQPTNPHADELLRRSKLPRDIAYNISRPASSQQSHVLLTGVTGFAGGHLLAELLQTGCANISCIIRASDKAIALKRAKVALQTWGLWKPTFEGLFNAICGDVSKPFLGLGVNDYLHLAREVDTIYHSAGAVSFIAPYAELEGPNVMGTIEILRFACTLRQKRLTYISTLSVFFNASHKLRCGEEVPVDDLHAGMVTGYAQSKWVAEQLVLEYARLGGHVLVLRPGRLLGSTKTYKCPPNDFTIRLIASMHETGVAPLLDDIGAKDWQIDLTPVDFFATLAHELSVQGETGIRHIINSRTLSFENLVGSLGVSVKRVSYQEWLPVVDECPHLTPLSSLFHELASDTHGKSTFEVLLQAEPFRRSNYEVTGLQHHASKLPSPLQLLHRYIQCLEA